jgi:hypothetical protein
MKCKMFLVCEAAFIDSRTNNLSLVNILDEISAQGLPVIIPKLFTVAVIERQKKEKPTPEFILRISQGKKKLVDQRVKVDFQGKKRVRQLIEFHGFTLHNPGDLCFRMNHKGRKFAEYHLSFNVNAGPRAEE